METTGKGPPRELFVYCVKGAFPEYGESQLGGMFVGNWLEDDYSYLFFEVESEQRVRQSLEIHSWLEYVDSYHFTYEEWQGRAVERMVAGSFEICPPWECGLPRLEGKTRIVLDPGVVFGSGLHPTTRDCLKALSWVGEEGRPHGILDLGTGTGILAVAGIFLGAGRAVAVDLNPLCIRTAMKNAVLNGVQSCMEWVCGPAGGVLNEPADVIAANIPFSVTAALLQEETFRQRHWLVLSGLMRSEMRELKHRLRGYGMDVVREWDSDMVWHTLLVKGENAG